jgi:large conductance mechanosensitive channel
VDFSNWFILLGDLPPSYTGDPNNYAQLKQAGVPMLGYGDFATQALDFLIVAFALFLMIKAVNRLLEEMQRKQKEAEDSGADPEVPTDPQLDVLKQILAELRQREDLQGGQPQSRPAGPDA